MNDQQAPERVRLRVDEFDRITCEMGLTSDLAISKVFGVSHTTIGKLRRGVHDPSTSFIARSLSVLRQSYRPDLKFEDLFVHDQEDAA